MERLAASTELCNMVCNTTDVEEPGCSPGRAEDIGEKVEAHGFQHAHNRMGLHCKRL
jgi:hypothetical protein